MQIEISKEANLPTKYGNFKIISFKETKENKIPLEHLVLFSEKIPKKPLLRVHSECLTGDALQSLKCDCGEELHASLQKIAQEGGILIYLRQEGRGIGLFNKVNAYSLQDTGLDTLEANIALGFKADERDYSIVQVIIDYFQLDFVRLLTNNPKKLDFFSKMVKVEREPIIIKANPHNKGYLQVKKEKMGHLL